MAKVPEHAHRGPGSYGNLPYSPMHQIRRVAGSKQLRRDHGGSDQRVTTEALPFRPGANGARRDRLYVSELARLARLATEDRYRSRTAVLRRRGDPGRGGHAERYG